MNMKYYVVDAFTEELFKGNPAGVCLVDEFPTDETMTNIAAENRLSETAFVKHKVDGIYRVRFFTPTSEVDLCGHATLGTGFVLANFVEPGKKEFHLRANQDDIVITVREGGLYEIEFPSWHPQKVAVTKEMEDALGFKPEAAWQTRDLIILAKDTDTVQNFQPDYQAIAHMTDKLGVLITAQASDSEFVSRTFFPNIGIPEDPVCGSANCSLIPLWSQRLGKKEIIKHQLSPRTGTIYCRDGGNVVKISGHVTLYSTAELNIH